MQGLTEKYPTIVFSTASIVMLLLAIPQIGPYIYYTLLRIVVCGTSAFIAYKAYEFNIKTWKHIAGFIAILFNPIVPICLNKETWVVIDLIAAVIMLLSIWMIKKPSGND